MKRLRNPFKALLAYTLTEIVIVMLVVAVIVAVTIGVTKHKLDSIVTYTYYSAYSSLRTATAQILADYDPTDERYQAKVESPSLLAKVGTFFTDNFGVLAARAENRKDPVDSIGNSTIRDPINDFLINIRDNQSCRDSGGTWCTAKRICVKSAADCNRTDNSNIGGPGGSITGSPITPQCPAGKKQCSASAKGASPVTIGGMTIYCCDDSGSGDHPYIMTQCPAGSSEPGPINPLCKSGDSNAFYIAAPELSITQGQMGKKLCCCPSGMKWNGSQCVKEQKDCEGTNPYKCGFCNQITGNWQNKLCFVGQHLDESTCECVSDENPECTGGKVWNGTECVCPEGTVEQGGSCVTPTPDCTGGRIWNGTECVCPEGKTWDGSQCKNSGDGSGGGEGCTGTAPCGKQCNASTGTWEDIPGFSRECDEEQNKVWNETQCSCVPSSRTITLNGQKYCEYLVSLLNTKANAAECTGPSISSTLTSFSGKLPDITLRNGMRMYNVRQNPQAIADLVNNTEGGKTVLNGVEVDTNKWGYTVYIDIDGEKGASEKWVDVYPFYVTLSGMVIPAYDKDHPGLYGGDSRNHMQVSIENEIIHEGRRKIEWLAKSVSYKEAACGAGYIGANTPYCHDAGSIPIKSECSVDNSLCRLKYIKPIKFLF